MDDKRSAKRNFFGTYKKPKGYKKYTLEWGDFNNRYNLYATDQDKITSFELLNPSFMAWLYDHAEQVSIEVVDNVVYVHCKSSLQSNYEVMLDILKRAYDELKR